MITMTSVERSLKALCVMIVLGACGGADTATGTACGPVTCGSGTVCCDHCAGSCVSEQSGASCPDDLEPDRTCNLQACGASASCNVEIEVCVGTGPIGPSVAHSCQPIPSGCEHDRTCECVSDSLCPSGTIACSDAATNEVFCDNGTQ